MRWIVFILFFTLQASAALQYLTKVIVAETSFENPTTNWYASDDATIQVDIGFDFPFNNTTYNQVWINSNGMLSFSSSNTAYSNLSLPYTSEAQSIYPYWDDLNRARGGTIKYGMLGDAPNRHFVISWDNVPHYRYAGSYSFQVVLYEDGAIRFRYLSGSSADGASATIGVQESTENYDQHLYNNAILNQNQDILYIPIVPNMHITKSSIVIDDPVNGISNPKRIPGATIRYCFTVDNDGGGDAESVAIHDSLTGDGKDNLDYVKSGFVVQDINTTCNCAAVSNTSGSISGTDVTITIGDLNGTNDTTHSRACAYIEVTVK